MRQSLALIQSSRRNLIRLIANVSEAALNEVPTGFNNHLIWNLGHVIVMQQMICYQFSGLPAMVGEEYFMTYQKGTKPLEYINWAAYLDLKALSATTINQLAADLESGVFKTYKTFSPSFYGVTITNMQEALELMAYHEAIHLLTCMAICRLVSMR